jgi:hypothetical protein
MMLACTLPVLPCVWATRSLKIQAIQVTSETWMSNISTFGLVGGKQARRHDVGGSSRRERVDVFLSGQLAVPAQQ